MVRRPDLHLRRVPDGDSHGAMCRHRLAVTARLAGVGVHRRRAKRALAARMPAGWRVYVRIPDMDPRSLEIAFRIARVFGVRPGDAFRYPDSPEVAA